MDIKSAYTQYDVLTAAGISFNSRSTAMDFGRKWSLAHRTGHMPDTENIDLGIELLEDVEDGESYLNFDKAPENKFRMTIDFIKIGTEVMGMYSLYATHECIGVTRGAWRTTPTKHKAGDKVYLKGYGPRYGTEDEDYNVTYSQEEFDILVAMFKAAKKDSDIIEMNRRNTIAKLNRLRKTYSSRLGQAAARGRPLPLPKTLEQKREFELQAREGLITPKPETLAKVRADIEEVDGPGRKRKELTRRLTAANNELEFANDKLDRELKRIAAMKKYDVDPEGTTFEQIESVARARVAVAEEALTDITEELNEPLELLIYDVVAEDPFGGEFEYDEDFAEDDNPTRTEVPPNKASAPVEEKQKSRPTYRTYRKRTILTAMDTYEGPFNKKGVPKLEPFKEHSGITSLKRKEIRELWNSRK